jgi:membrane protein YdbS with pleckstrin-like domain
MPVRIKIFISLLAALVVGGFAYLQLGDGNERVAYAGFALAAFMVLAIWIFPETGKVRRQG